jgi:hypothetical protein
MLKKTTVGILTVLISLSCVASSDPIILTPAASTTGTEMAIVWIHGASCDSEAYTTIAQATQAEGAKNGLRIWVGIPEFILDVPEPILIDKYFDEALEGIKAAGFTGD